MPAAAQEQGVGDFPKLSAAGGRSQRFIAAANPAAFAVLAHRPAIIENCAE
jgi:hypothetical protein